MKDNEKMKTKNELSENAWKRIRKLIEERHISQVELQRMCREQGYRISQPEISKLFSGKLQINLYQISAFAEALGVSTDYLIYEKEMFHRLHVDGSAFLTDPANDAFDGYRGDYYVVFHNTSPFDQNVLHGKLSFSISPKKDICQALFELDSGEMDDQGLPIIKRYQGQLLISKRLSVAYCILVNDRIGEISMIEFRHRSFLIKQAECRLGLVLTTAAGENKRPVTHRIFLSRTPIDEETLSKVLPYLKQEPEEILISVNDLETVIKECDSIKYNLRSFLESNEKETFILLDERMIRNKNRRLNRFEIAEIMSALKKYSVGQYNLALSEKDDNTTYDLMRSQI